MVKKVLLAPFYWGKNKGSGKLGSCPQTWDQTLGRPEFKPRNRIGSFHHFQDHWTGKSCPNKTALFFPVRKRGSLREVEGTSTKCTLVLNRSHWWHWVRVCPEWEMTELNPKLMNLQSRFPCWASFMHCEAICGSVLCRVIRIAIQIDPLDLQPINWA